MLRDHHSLKPTCKVGVDDSNNRDLDRATAPPGMVRQKLVALLRTSVCEGKSVPLKEGQLFIQQICADPHFF
jgi:hypothetical protein